MSKNILLFAGTTEGRLVSQMLVDNTIESYVFVATESGTQFIENNDLLHINVGRLTRADMEKVISDLQPELIIDATHPFAVEVSKNIYNASKNTGTKLIRVVRSSDYKHFDYEKIKYFDDIDSLIKYINVSEIKDKRIFSTLGAKEAPCLTNIVGYKDRVVVRILPAPESIEICHNAGFDDSNIVAMMPPYTVEINEQMFSDYNCQIMITKETGDAGGYNEKLKAAINLNMTILIIRKPLENDDSIKMNISEIENFLSKYNDI